MYICLLIFYHFFLFKTLFRRPLLRFVLNFFYNLQRFFLLFLFFLNIFWLTLIRFNVFKTEIWNFYLWCSFFFNNIVFLFYLLSRGGRFTFRHNFSMKFDCRLQGFILAKFHSWDLLFWHFLGLNFYFRWIFFDICCIWISSCCHILWFGVEIKCQLPFFIIHIQARP